MRTLVAKKIDDPQFLEFLFEHLKDEEGLESSPQKKEKKKPLKNILLQKFKHVAL
jgi:hypothetical protein